MAKDGSWIEPQPKVSAGPRPPDTAGQVRLLLGKDHLGPDVIRTLAALGDEVVPALGAIATGTRPAPAYERENAIYVLGMIGRDGAVDYLTQVLWTPDLNLQVLAARALGRIGSPPALAELRRLYNGAVPRPLPPALAMELREVLGHLAPPGDGSLGLQDSETIYPLESLD